MRTQILFTTALILALAFCIVRETNAQPGSLDTTFSSDGKVITTFSGNADCRAMAMQSDGKIVLAGYKDNGFYDDFVVARYNSDGTLDNTFGSGGTATTNFNGSQSAGWSVAIQGDGKIVVAGERGSNPYDFALARYNNNGTLDNTFGSGGKITTDFGNNWDMGYSVAIQSDGKIVASGYGGGDFALARYNSNGTLDNTFGSGGKVTTDFGNGGDWSYSVVIQNDGKILVAGAVSNGTNNDFALARYNSNGTLDNTFGSGGKITTDFGNGDGGSSVVIQTDGKIVVAGTSSNGTNNDFALVRYNSDGTLDNTFGSGGKITTDFGSGYDDRGQSAAIQSDGKIVVVGYSDNGVPLYYDFALVRYNTDGSLDNTFGTGGKVTTNFIVGNTGRSVAIQSDGKIVAAGSTNSGRDFAVARYKGGDISGIMEESNESSFHVSIYPNPFTASATLSISHAELGSASMRTRNKFGLTFTMYDLLGREVYHSAIRTPNSEIKRGNLPAGMYFYKVTDGIKILGTGKVVIQ